MLCIKEMCIWKRASVVGDGYANGPTIEDVKHIRVAGGCAAPTVHVSEQTLSCLDKETLMANEGNKQRFSTC